MNEYKNFRGRGRGPFHFRGPNPNMFNNARGRGGNNFAPMLPAPNFRDNKLRWQRPHMNAYNWRPPNINAPSFHHNARFPLLPPPRHPMPPRPLMSKPPAISRPLSPLPGSEEARQKAIAEASARIKEQLNLNEGASTSISCENIPTTTTPVNILTPQCFVSVLPPVPHDENQHKIPEKITRKRVRKSTNSVQSVDVEELRKKILTQFTYMSKGKIQSLVNNPGSTRYDAALQHLVRDMRLHLSSELRTMYNNRENEYSKESNEMIDHFNSIVPDLGVELVSLPDTMVAELSKILQLDINNDLEVPERRSSSGSDCTLVEPEKMFKEAEKLLSESNFITMHPFEDDIHTSRTSEFALNSRIIDTSASSTQQAVETMSENAFLAMNSSSIQSCSIFMDARHSPATSNYSVNEPVDNLLSESTYLTTQAPTTFLCALDDRTLASTDRRLPAQVNTELENDILTRMPCSEQLKTNDYVDNNSECREQTLWDIPCDNMAPDFIGICEDEIIHIPESLAIDDTDYTVDNIIFNMDDTNVINMDVSNSNLDTTDLIPDDSKLNDIHTNHTDVNIDNSNIDNTCKSTDLDVSNTEFIVNNTNVDFANTNFNLDNTNSNKGKINLKPVNTIECNTVQVKQNSVKKKNLINIKLNLNKTNFHGNKANFRKDPTSLTMDSCCLSLDDITLPPVNFDVNVDDSNVITTNSTSITTNRTDLSMNPTNPTAANTVINTEINNIPSSELTVNIEVAPDLNDINHNMNDINPNMNDEINSNISGINPSPEDTDPFLTKNPLFNPPPSTPRIRSCSPDVRFCNPPFVPTVPANTGRLDIIHDSPELQTSNNQLDIDLLDRIANISATLNKDDTIAIKTVAQHCPSNVNAVNNAPTLFDFDSVWISKKNLPARQTSVNNSSAVNNNTNTTENNAPKRDLKSKQTVSATSTVSNKSEENLSRNTCNSVKSINVQESKFITRSKSHESIYEMTRERFHDSLSDRVPSVDSSRTSSINHEEKQHDVHGNSYDKNTDGRHNRYKYNRRCRSKSPTDSHKKYKQSLNERIRNMMTVKNDTTDKRKLSKRQQKELYKRKMLEEQNAKFKAKKKRFKICVASEKDRQMSVVRNIRGKQEDGQIKKKCENVQKRRIENVPKKKTIDVRQKIVGNVQIIEVKNESKSQIEEVQKKNVHTQKKHNEAVLKKKLETVQKKNVEDTQKKTVQNAQNKKDTTKKKIEEAQKKKSDNTPKKIANDTQKMNTGDLQFANRIEKAVSLQYPEYPGSYTPPISCDIMKNAESKGNSLQSSVSATSQVLVQSISSVTNNIDSGSVDNNKFISEATVEQLSPVGNDERKLPGTPVKTPAQKKEYSIDNSPSRKLVGLKRDIEQNITKLAQTVQNILKTNAEQQKLSVAAPLITSDDQLTVRTAEVTSDNVSENNTEPVKRTIKVTRSKITKNDNTTDSVNVKNSIRASGTNKSISNSIVNTSNVKANTSNMNTLRKANEQIKLYPAEKTSKTLLKTLAKEARDNSIEQTQKDAVTVEIKEEPESMSSSSDESNDYLDLDIKEEDESSNKVIDQLAGVQECTKNVTVSNVVDKVNNKHSNDSTNNKEISEPKSDTAQTDTTIDKTIEDQPKENAGNKTQSKEISETKQSDKIENILLENSDSVQRESIESLTEHTADINTSGNMTKEICQDASNKDENKSKESKDTRNKRTEKTSVNKIDKSNKAEKSSSSRSNSKEKITITRCKSVEKEKGDKIKRKEVSKTDKPRDRSKESDKRGSSIDKTNVDSLKTTDERKTHSEEMKKSKSNSNLPQKKANRNEDLHKKNASTKDKSTSTVKSSTIKKPETKTKSTNTPHEKLEKASIHKESPKKTKESDKSYSKREKDKKDSTENCKSVDIRLTPNLDTPKESIETLSAVNSTLGNSAVGAQSVETCISIDTSCHPQDNILNRLITIDMEIQKLMHEKWNLYKKLKISDMQVPLLMPNIQVDSPKPCICTESSRKRTFSPSHSEISVGENITSTYSTCRTHLSVTPSESSSTEKESEMPSKKRRLSITLSESSVSESIHIKTPSEQSRMRQLSGTPTETITINEMQQIRAETPISITVMNQHVSNTPSQSSITNESSQIRDDTPISVASRPRQVSVTPSESSVTNNTSQNLIEVSTSETLRPRQLSITPSESSVTNETLQIRDKTPISDILRPRQLSVTPSESSITNDNPRKRPLSITPSESSLTEHTESVKNDNDPSDDIDSEMKANKTPKKKRLQKRITPKRKKKSTDDLEDPIDVFTEDDANNDSNSNVQKFRVKLPNMKTRNKNRKLLDLFTENDETRLNRSERAMKPDTNIYIQMETAAVQKCKEADEEVACVKSGNKSKPNPNNVEEDMEQVQPQDTMKTDVKTRTISKIKKPIGLNYDMEIKDKELHKEIHSPTIKSRNKHKTKQQDKRIQLETATSQETRHEESLMKQSETIVATETRGRKTRTSVSIELNVEQTQNEEATKKDDASRKYKMDEIPVIKTRTRTKSRSTCNVETEQSKNVKTLKANDDAKEDIDKLPSKRLKISPTTTDVTDSKKTVTCDESSEDDNIPLLVRVATLFKDNEPEVKPTKSKTKITKNKNKLIEELPDICAKEISTIGRETRRRSTSLCKEIMDSKNKLKTMKIAKDDSTRISASLSTVIDVRNLVEKPVEKLIPPVINPDDPVSNIQRTSSLSKDTFSIVSETEQTVSDQPRKVGRPKSKKKIIRKPKLEDISISEMPVAVKMQNNIVECLSPVVTTPCFVQLERVNIPAINPNKSDTEEAPISNLSPAIEILPEVEHTIVEEQPMENNGDTPIIAQITVVDNIIRTMPSTSKTIDDNPIEHNDNNIVHNTVEPEQNTSNKQDDVNIPEIIEPRTAENVPVEQKQEVQNITLHEEPLPEKEIVEEVDLIGDDGIFCMGHQKSILDIKVIGDEFLAASEDGTIYKYCMKTGSLQDAYTGHKKAVTCMYLVNGSVLNIDSPLLYSGSLDCCLKCYNIDTAETVHHVTVEQAIQCMDSAWGHIFLGTYDGLLFIYNIKKKLLHDQSLTIASATVLMIKATTEGSRQILILASRKREIMVRDAFTGLLLRTMCQEQRPTIYSLYLDRSMVYCGTSDKGILILDFNDGSQIGAYTAGKGVVCMLMYKALLFAGCYDGMIYVYNTRTQKQVKAIAGPGDGMLLSLAISNNIIIAGTKKDHLLKIWKVPQDILNETLS
ncbi:uncharacterized protein CBL_03946 [Carabus blaptoides fortunei]